MRSNRQHIRKRRTNRGVIMFRKILCKLGFHDWIYTKFCNVIGSKRHCNYCYTQQQYDYDGNHYKWFRIEDFNPLLSENLNEK